MHFNQLMIRAERIVRSTIATLPPLLREPAAAVPVAYEPIPNAALQADDVEADTLGLFVGPSRAEDPADDGVPSQIVLFLNNIYDYAEEDIEAFDDEVRLTYLHELGHYLGLEEGDLEKRGLD